jgi:hypothetical protein
VRKSSQQKTRVITVTARIEDAWEMKERWRDRAGNESYLERFRDQGPGARKMGFEYFFQDQISAKCYYTYWDTSRGTYVLPYQSARACWGGLTGRAA